MAGPGDTIQRDRSDPPIGWRVDRQRHPPVHQAMTRFLELWRDHRFDPDLLRVVDNRSERFPSVVREHPILHLWHPGQSFPTDQPRLLIGVATWSGYDMLLLDLIASERLLSDRPNDTTVRVDVFDVAA